MIGRSQVTLGRKYALVAAYIAEQSKLPQPL